MEVTFVPPLVLTLLARSSPPSCQLLRYSGASLPFSGPSSAIMLLCRIDCAKKSISKIVAPRSERVRGNWDQTRSSSPRIHSVASHTLSPQSPGSCPASHLAASQSYRRPGGCSMGYGSVFVINIIGEAIHRVLPKNGARRGRIVDELDVLDPEPMSQPGEAAHTLVLPGRHKQLIGQYPESYKLTLASCRELFLLF